MPNTLAMASWSSLTTYLQSVPNEVTLTWPELDVIVGGMPSSASNHRAWWSGDRTHVQSWRSAGFDFKDLRMGSRVTFVRIGDRPEAAEFKSQSIFSTRAPEISSSNVAQVVGAEIILVSCVKSKLSVSALAKDLYTSALFRKERAYAEGKGVPWYILSAEYGLVDPEQWLAPYERYLPDESKSYRQEWGARVVVDLVQREGAVQGKVIEVHAGSVYLETIRSPLESRGAIVLDPLSGLPMGKRLQWYGWGTTTQYVETSRGPETPLPGIDSLIASLRNESMATSPRDFLTAGSAGRKTPGLYSWWVDVEGAHELTAGLGYPVPAGLIYAGLAGATHWPSGKPSSNTLWSRIATMHLGGNHEFSTFRRTIGAILASADGRSEVDEIALSKWMDAHLRVLAVPFEDADSLGRVEQAVLIELDPPLNLKGMPNSKLRQHLKTLRRVVTK